VRPTPVIRKNHTAVELVSTATGRSWVPGPTPNGLRAPRGLKLRRKLPRGFSRLDCEWDDPPRTPRRLMVSGGHAWRGTSLIAACAPVSGLELGVQCARCRSSGSGTRIRVPPSRERMGLSVSRFSRGGETHIRVVLPEESDVGWATHRGRFRQLGSAQRVKESQRDGIPHSIAQR